MPIFNNFSNIFSIFLLLLYKDITGKSGIEIKTCGSCQSSVKHMSLKSTGESVGFFIILHDKLVNRKSKTSGTVRA